MKKVILWLLLLLLPLEACGIQNQRRETAELELVRCIGVDRQEESVAVTIAVSGGEEKRPATQCRRAKTLSQALADLQNAPTLRQPYYAHTGHVLLGEAAAREGVGPTLDYLARSVELPLSIGLFLALGEAGELLRDSAGEETDAEEVLSVLERQCPRSGLGCVFTAQETAAALQQRGCALMLAVAGEKTDLGDEEAAPLRIAPRGFGVLTEGRLSALLTEEESRGALLLLDRFKGEELALGEDAVLRLTGARVRWTPSFDRKGALRSIRAEIRLSAAVSALRPGMDPGDPQVLKSLERRAEEIQRDRVLAALRRQKELGVDFLDLESRLRLRAPEKMERAAASGVSFMEAFKTAELALEVEVTAERSFDLIEALGVRGEDGHGEE